MSAKKRRQECGACFVKRICTEYDLGVLGVSRNTFICESCANVTALTGLMDDQTGRMLLSINSKLDILLRKK